MAWLLWHSARVEDVGVNRFVTDGRQVLDDGWLDRLGVGRRDVGTAMKNDAEVDALSAQIDLGALTGYWEALTERTLAVRIAPHSRLRRPVVTYGRTGSEPTGSAGGPAVVAPVGDAAGAPHCPRHWSWAALMQRAFAIDVLACPNCGGRMRLIATIHDPAVIRRILARLGLSRSGQSPGPAPPEPSLPP